VNQSAAVIASEAKQSIPPLALTGVFIPNRLG
jgi:hypothetical protein